MNTTQNTTYKVIITANTGGQWQAYRGPYTTCETVKESWKNNHDFTAEIVPA